MEAPRLKAVVAGQGGADFSGADDNDLPLSAQSQDFPEAAGQFGPGLTAEDLPALAPAVLAELWRSAGEGER